MSERRTQVWELRKAGGSVRSIARQLGVSHVTIAKDLQATLAELAEQQHGRADEWRALHVSRLEQMILGLWQKASYGDTQAVAAVNKLLERESALLGLDAPKRQELSGPDGQPIELSEELNVHVSLEERRSRILTLLADRRGLALPEPNGTLLGGVDASEESSVAPTAGPPNGRVAE